MNGNPAASFLVHALALLLLFLVADRAMLRLGHLEGDAYAEPLLVLGLLERAGWPLALFATATVVLLAWRGALLVPWHGLHGGRELRVFIAVCSAILVWFFVTRGYNAFLGQAHAADRLILLALWLGLLWRPAMILPLTLLLAVFIWGLRVPGLGGSILAHKLQVFHVLSLFCAVVLLHAITRERRTTGFVFLLACMVAGSYVTAAFAKLAMGWWAQEGLYLMPVSAYGHGWLHPFGPEAVGSLAAFLKPLDPIMRGAVLVLEAGCLIFVLRRSVSVALLSGLIAFHTGVLLLYGFFFWTWMLLDAALIWLLLKRGDLLHETGSPRVAFALSVVLISSALYWSRPPWLGWYDTGLSYSYRLETADASGQAVALHPAFFGPYEDVFTMTAFSYLSNAHKVLTGAYGVTHDRAVAKAILSAESRDEVFELEGRLGSDRFSSERAERLRHFLERYVAGLQEARGDSEHLRWLRPPPQFISMAPGSRTLPEEPLSELRLLEITTWFNGDAPEEIRKLEVMRVKVRKLVE